MKIGRLVPSTGAITEWAIPTTKAADVLSGIAVDHFGGVWFGIILDNKVCRLVATTNQLTLWALPYTSQDQNSAGAVSFSVNAGGRVFFDEYFQVRTPLGTGPQMAMLNPADSTLTEWMMPISSDGWYGVAADYNEDAYFGSTYAFGMINSTTNTFSIWWKGTPYSQYTEYFALSYTGFSLFATAFNPGTIIRLAPWSNIITEWTPWGNNQESLSGIAVDENHQDRIFVTSGTTNQVAVLDQATNWTFITWALADSSSPGVISLDSSGNAYFSESGANRIAMLSPFSSTTTTSTASASTTTTSMPPTPSSTSATTFSSSSSPQTTRSGPTVSPVHRASLGGTPVGVAVNPVTGLVYVAEWYPTNAVAVMDGKTWAMGQVIHLDGPALDVAVNPSTNTIYATNDVIGAGASGYGEVSVIDGSTATVTSNVRIGPDAYGLAVNPAANRLYVTSRGSDVTGGSLVVVDMSANSVVANVTLESAPGAVAVNPTTNAVYVTAYNGNTMWVIDGSSNTVVTRLTMQNQASALAVDSATGFVYAVNSRGYSVAVIDGVSNSIVASVTGWQYQYVQNDGIAYNPSTNWVYVSSTINGMLSVVDPSTNSVAGTVSFENSTSASMSPHNLAVDPTTGAVFMVSRGDSAIRVFADSSPIATTTTTATVASTVATTASSITTSATSSSPSSTTSSSTSSYSSTSAPSLTTSQEVKSTSSETSSSGGGAATDYTLVFIGGAVAAAAVASAMLLRRRG